MRYLVDEMPRKPIDCPFCEPSLYTNIGEYRCSAISGICNRFTHCPFPNESQISCEMLIAVPDIITRAELTEALTEASRRA